VNHRVAVELDDFGWVSLCREAELQGVLPEELLAHAALYYLSDVHSGRIAVRVPEALGPRAEPAPKT